MQTLSNIVTEKDLLDFSQHFSVQRNYLGSTLFPDRKTEFIEQEYYRFCENGTLPMVAKVHAFDTEAAIGSRSPFEKVTVEELLIKEKINLTESLRRTTRGLDMPEDSLRRYIFDDVARMAERVVARAELAKMDAITKGKFTIEENGLSMEVDYDIPTDNFVRSDWTDKDADILGDIAEWRNIALSHGVAPTMAITTEKVMLAIKANKGVQTAIAGTSGIGMLPTNEQINALFMSQFGITVRTNEERYGTFVTSSGKLKIAQNRFFPEDKFVMIYAPGGTIGAGLWGVTPEEAAQGGAFDEKRQQQYVTAVRWDTVDPVTTWTKASGLFVPVMPNVYGHIIADVSVLTLDEMDIDQLKAYAAAHSISLTGKTTKAEILAAIKAAGNSEG